MCHAHFLHAAQVVGAAGMTSLASSHNIVVVHIHVRPAGSAGVTRLAVFATHQRSRDMIRRLGRSPR